MNGRSCREKKALTPGARLSDRHFGGHAGLIGLPNQLGLAADDRGLDAGLNELSLAHDGVYGLDGLVDRSAAGDASSSSSFRVSMPDYFISSLILILSDIYI